MSEKILVRMQIDEVEAAQPLIAQKRVHVGGIDYNNTETKPPSLAADSVAMDALFNDNVCCTRRQVPVGGHNRVNLERVDENVAGADREPVRESKAGVRVEAAEASEGSDGYCRPWEQGGLRCHSPHVVHRIFTVLLNDSMAIEATAFDVPVSEVQQNESFYQRPVLLHLRRIGKE